MFISLLSIHENYVSMFVCVTVCGEKSKSFKKMFYYSFQKDAVGEKGIFQSLILQFVPLENMREVCNVHLRYTLTETECKEIIQDITL